MVDTLGFRISEQVLDDDGRQVGSWLHVTPKSYDLAYGRVDPDGMSGRLHHVAFAVDAREYVLRAADVFLDEGVRIEAGPAKHAVQQTFFLYAFEPGGNRIEVISDGRLILAPDWPPVTWTLEERKRGQAWRTAMPESWFTYATPPASHQTNVPEEQ
jgi:catechol 2,3-dioxygenase-like lactoylglutathione lyase family enzyme